MGGIMRASLESSPYCRYCGYPVGHRGGRPGFRYGDNIVICKPCHDISVKTDDALTMAWRFVVRSCTDLGLHANWPDIKVRLRNTPDITSMSGNQKVIGLARTQWCGLLIESDITILYGMPLPHAIETLAHEAGHIWCHEHQVKFTPNGAEEGFCNVVACLVVQRLPVHLNPKDRVDALFSNPDPVYGDHFRTEWQAMNDCSWQRYIRKVQQHRNTFFSKLGFNREVRHPLSPKPPINDQFSPQEEG
jgi:hypothetical protein